MVLSKLRGFPLIWNTLAGSVLFAAADVSQQKIERRPVYDPGSTGRYMVVGGVFGPMSYVWHTKLEQFLPGNTRSMVVKKVFLTSSITGAIFNFLFYTLHSVLERKEDIFAEAKEKWFKTYMTAWLYWPFLNSLNFMYVPPHVRGVTANVFGFVWTVILCFYKRKDFSTPPNVTDAPPDTSSVKQL